jgi:DUF4097 and DUF4098 domain-containing protein YvlB
MRKLILPLLFTASGLLAFQPTPSLDCHNNHGNDRAGHFCEIREQTMSAGGMLNVDASQNGGISLKGWDRADVLVRAHVQAQAANDDEARALARQITIQANGTQVRAVGPASSSENNGWSVTYEIFVPRHSSAKLTSHNGGVSVSDVDGDLEMETTNGGLSLNRVAGSVRGRTTNGGVSVQLAGDHWEGQGLDVKTTNGGVRLKVPQGYSAQIEASTQNGSIKADVPELQSQLQSQESRRPTHVAGAMGRGGPLLKVSTTNGGVSLSR